MCRLYLVWVDGGYSGQPCLQWVMDRWRWVVHTVGFVLLKKRWIGERTFGWWQWYRRLNYDYEALLANAETMIDLAMIGSWCGGWGHLLHLYPFSNSL